MKWQSTLPDVSQWQPKSNHIENLSVGLLLTCQTFYKCFIQMLGHLTRSVLEVHDLHRLYGVSNSENEHFAHDKALYNRNDTRRM